ncbi:MAG: FtsW/RodA/SpoVE family cell cycle protein, partial [Clostridia bacterium]|nr:FtsW/RodA/SpoVE family cell cycle protein [Clostridia bacterium]
MKNLIYRLRTVIRETDFALLLLCILTSAYGVVMVYSATRPDMLIEGGVISRDTRAMLIAVGAGLLMAIVISFIDYNIITKLYPAIAAVCIALMLLTLVFGVGPEERPDAKTWLKIGETGLFFQPSELLKIGFIISFGMHLELISDRISKPVHILFLCLHAAVPVGLVTLSGDMGSALVFVIIFAAMMFCAGVKL